jgi:hypothetical protein
MSGVLDPKTIKAADDFLDGDDQLEVFRDLGKRLFEVFGADQEGRVNTQLRNLQQIVVSARRLADVEDFVKNQMGKTTQASRNWRQVGDAVLQQLRRLRDQATGLSTDEARRLQLRLHLARGWVRAVVGAYLYAKARQEMTTNHA